MTDAPKHVQHDAGKHGSIQLYRPRHFSRAVQIQRLAVEQDEPVLACAAALGLTWQNGTTDRKPRADWVKCRGAWRYGEAVIDELIGRGWTVGAIIDGGRAALPLITNMIVDMVSEDEVREAEAFTEAGGG